MFEEVPDDLPFSTPREYAVESDDMLERDLEDSEFEWVWFLVDLIIYWISSSARNFEDAPTLLRHRFAKIRLEG